MERPARDKHSSLLRTIVNYGRKKFYNIGPWNDKVAEVAVEPVAVAVDVETHQPVVEPHPIEIDPSLIPRSRASRGVTNGVTQRHAKDEDDPGKIFKISSYNSFQPVVRRSPSMLEKIKLFSDAADSAKEQVHVRHSFPSYNPLLPKNSPFNQVSIS
jgi:hypothetical protein